MMAMNLVAPNTAAAAAPAAGTAPQAGVAAAQPQVALPILDVMPVAAPVATAVAAPTDAGAFAVLMASQPTLQPVQAAPVADAPQQAPVAAVLPAAVVQAAAAEADKPAVKAEEQQPAGDEAVAPVVPSLELPAALLAMWAQMTPVHAPAPQAAEIEPAPAPAKPAASTAAPSSAPLPAAPALNIAALAAPAPHGRVVEGREAVLPESFARHFEPAVQRQEAAPITAAPAAAPAEPVALRGAGEQWQQPLLRALGDRLQVQIAARSEQAQIRLEPPRLGAIDIQIRHEAGQLSVAIRATHDEVVQQVREISQQLRNDLVQRHRGEVELQVSSAGEARMDRQAEAGGQRQSSAQQQTQQQQQQQQRRPGRALGEEAEQAFAAAE